MGKTKAINIEPSKQSGRDIRAESAKNKAQLSVSPITHIAEWAVGLVLVGVPFHAFLTVWASTTVGHYTVLRLWPECIAIVLAVWALVMRQAGQTWRALQQKHLAWPIATYLGINALYFVSTFLWGDAGLRAASYGLLLNVRPVGWFVLVYSVARNRPWLSIHWQRLLVWPLIAVAVFALLQFFVLPPDVLKHFGYSKDITITPVQTINQDTSTIRVQSFLRGANPLGAYLVLGISLVLAMAIRRWQKLCIVAVSILAMVFSFSRSAWLGLMTMFVAQFSAARGLLRGKRTVLPLLVAVLALLVAAIFIIRSNQSFKTAFLHVNDHSTAPQTSNEGRLVALQNGVNDVVREPLGRGVGTSGPASAYHAGHKSRNSENYFLSLGQEIGWLGLGTFVLICYRLAVRLYMARSPLSRALFASFVGLTLVNLLSYAWSDTTLTYLWWGLAAIALAAYDNPRVSFAKKTASNANDKWQMRNEK